MTKWVVSFKLNNGPLVEQTVCMWGMTDAMNLIRQQYSSSKVEIVCILEAKKQE